jgi:hypothetical protein
MFHDVFVYESGNSAHALISARYVFTICPKLLLKLFTICFCYVARTICFTICLFISPDLDGHFGTLGTNDEF